MPGWIRDDHGLCNFDDMGGDHQIGKAYSIRYTLVGPVDGLNAMVTVGFYSEDHWGQDGDPNADQQGDMTAGERFGIGMWIELVRCRDPKLPGDTAEFEELEFRSSWFRRGTPFQEEQIEALMENFKPNEWIYWDGADGVTPSMGWGSMVEGFAYEDWDGMVTPEINWAIEEILAGREWARP